MQINAFLALTIVTVGLLGCVDPSTDGASTSASQSQTSRDPNIPRYGAEEFIKSGRFGANPSFYQRKMQEARVENSLRLRANFYSQAVSAASNDREYYLAVKASIEAYEAIGRRSDAVQMAANANRVMPSNPSFIAYLVRNGLRPYDPNYVPDIGFSRGDLFAIAGAYVGVATAATHLACGTGNCNVGSDAVSIDSQSTGKEYSCRVTCTTSALAASTGLAGDSVRQVIATIRAGSNSQARRSAQDQRRQICQQNSYLPLAGGAVSCS